MENKLNQMIYEVTRHLQKIDSLSDADILTMITELKSETHVWQKLASGNRNYLQATLDTKTPNYVKGAKEHLKAALPHRLGFIVTEIEAKHRIGDATFDQVLEGRRTIDQLKPDELIQFLRDFNNSDDIKKLLHAGVLDNNRRTVSMWLEAYDKRHSRNIADAYQYLEDKRDKIFNLFYKAIFPNLMGAIARSL